MTVHVRSKQGGQLPPVTRFQDTFVRASGALGNDWAQATAVNCPFIAPITSGFASIGAIFGGGQGLLWSQCGNLNPASTWFTYLLPLQLSHFYFGNFNGADQFVECERVRINANGASFVLDCGLAINWQPDTKNGYILQTATDNDNAWRLFRREGQTSTLLASADPATADNDVYGLTAEVNAGDVTLRVFLNSVLQNTFVDNGATRVTSGLPCLVGGCTAGAAGGPQSHWINFSAGLGLNF
jgi:hypothetical protein